MKELVSPDAVERSLLFAAIAGPLVGLIIGLMLGAHERHARCRTAAGVLMGSLLTATYGIWKLYGAITDALGLDSVLNLALQIVLFAVLGALLGAAIFRICLVFKRSSGRVDSRPESGR